MEEQKEYLTNINEPVKNSVATLVLGILSLVTCIFYGVLAIILGIIALSISAGPKRDYLAYPDQYDRNSYNQLNAGRVCAIVGLCLGILFLLLLILGISVLSKIGS